MSSSVPSTNQSRQHASQGVWPSITPFVVPPLAASIAIIPVFRDMIVKSAQQKGQPIPSLSMWKGMKEGLKSAPTIGMLVGTQMMLQQVFEKTIGGAGKEASLSSILGSSAAVGIVSSPVVAIFNGQTMGWSVKESLRKFSPKQCMAISIQETAFVGALSAANRLAKKMKRIFGDNKTVEYAAAYTAGYAGSLAGHPANTALTRWQSGLKIESIQQLAWGAARKAHGIGKFSVAYKLGKELYNYLFNSK